MLKERVLTSFIVLPLALLIIWQGGYWLLGLCLLIAFALSFEFYSFSGQFSLLQRLLLSLVNLLLPLGFLIWGWGGFISFFLIAVFAHLFWVVSVYEYEEHVRDPFDLLATCLIGLCYPGLFGSCLLITSILVDVAFIWWLLGVVVCTDTFAYFGGRAFGGPKLAPRISPKKTLSGSICGFFGALLATYVFWLYVDIGLSFQLNLLIGGLIGLFSQIGDLLESLVKRCYHVKDSGSILPGHGGCLDRLDGLIFAAPLLLTFQFLLP